MLPDELFFTPANGIQLHTLKWRGDSAKTPIVHLPGFINNGYGAMWFAQAIDRTRDVYALELRGRGQSDKPPAGYGLGQHLDDLEAWLDEMALDTCILLGHSFGAILSIAAYRQMPNRFEKIVLLDGGIPPSEIGFQLFKAYHENLTYQYPSVGAYIAPYRALPTLQPWTHIAETLVRHNIIEQPDGSALRVVPPHVVQAELDALNLSDWQVILDVYKQIRVPVLLIRAGMGSFGVEDQHITDERLGLLRNIPDFSLHEMQHTGHTGILTIEDATRDRAFRDFIDSP